jgi:N-acetylglutamate synthase-like GNAT family acetyltransferase
MTMQIRHAHVDDVAAVCDVLRRSISELCEADHGNDPQFLAGWLANKTPENVATWIANSDNFFLVALDNGALAGAAAMTKAGTVTLNYVSPNARFRGVSKALLARLEHKAAELGLTQCDLISTRTAMRFYRSAGYRERDDLDSERGIPMTKGIIPPAGVRAR